MGYQHYWVTQKHSPKQWRSFLVACRKLADNFPSAHLMIAGADGKGKPLFSNWMVEFNGFGDSGNESFRIYADSTIMSWSCCNTNGKPYDLLVVSCLIAAHEYLGYAFTSDAFLYNDLDRLDPGIDFYNAVVMPDEPVTIFTLLLQTKIYEDIY